MTFKKPYSRGIRSDYFQLHDGQRGRAVVKYNRNHDGDGNELLDVKGTDVLNELRAQEDKYSGVVIRTCYATPSEQMAFSKVPKLLLLQRENGIPNVPASFENCHSVEGFVVAISDVLMEKHLKKTRGKLKGLISDGASTVEKIEMECLGERHLDVPEDGSPCSVSTDFAGILEILIKDSADGKSFDATSIMATYNRGVTPQYGKRWKKNLWPLASMVPL